MCPSPDPKSQSPSYAHPIRGVARNLVEAVFFVLFEVLGCEVKSWFGHHCWSNKQSLKIQKISDRG
jgi:hypothetical protein